MNNRIYWILLGIQILLAATVTLQVVSRRGACTNTENPKDASDSGMLIPKPRSESKIPPDLPEEEQQRNKENLLFNSIPNEGFFLMPTSMISKLHFDLRKGDGCDLNKKELAKLNLDPSLAPALGQIIREAKNALTSLESQNITAFNDSVKISEYKFSPYKKAGFEIKKRMFEKLAEIIGSEMAIVMTEAYSLYFHFYGEKYLKIDVYHETNSFSSADIRVRSTRVTLYDVGGAERLLNDSTFSDDAMQSRYPYFVK